MSGYFKNSYLDKVGREVRVSVINKAKQKSKKISKARTGKTYKKKGRGRPKGDTTIENIVGNKGRLKGGGNVYVVSAKRGKYKSKPNNPYFSQFDSRNSSRGTFTPVAPKGGWVGWNKENMDRFNKETRRRRDDEGTFGDAVKYGKEIERQKQINREQQEDLRKLSRQSLRLEENMEGLMRIQEREKFRGVSEVGGLSRQVSKESARYSDTELGRSVSQRGKSPARASSVIKTAVAKPESSVFSGARSLDEIREGGAEGIRQRLKETERLLKTQEKTARTLDRDARKLEIARLKTETARAKEIAAGEKRILSQAKQSTTGAALTSDYYTPVGSISYDARTRSQKQRIDSYLAKQRTQRLSEREDWELKQLQEDVAVYVEDKKAERRTENEAARLMSMDDPFDVGGEPEPAGGSLVASRMRDMGRDAP